MRLPWSKSKESNQSSPLLHAVAETISRITLPGSEKNGIEAKRITGLQEKDGRVVFAVEIDPEDAKDQDSERFRNACKEMSEYREACTEAVKAIPGVEKVIATLTVHYSPGEAPKPEPTPVSTPKKKAEPDRELPVGLKDVKHIIAVASGKGGVGKSTVAVNLAAALAARGLKTGLLDADIYGPSIPKMLGVSGKPDAEDDKILPVEAHGLKSMSIGYMIEENTPVIWRGPMVISALTQMMRDVAWGDLDVMVIDLPPGTGDVQLSLVQKVPLTGAVIVSTPQEVALIDARKGLEMFRKTDVPILGLIENMSWFENPNGEKSFIFGEGGVKRTAVELNAEFLGEVPIFEDLRSGGDEGRPVVAVSPSSPAAQPFVRIAEVLADQLGL